VSIVAIRKRSGKCATFTPPFLQRTTPIACSSLFLCQGCTWHDLHIQVTALFCCDQKARAASAQSLTIEITCHDHSLRMPAVTFNPSCVSISRDYTPRSLHYCLFMPHIHGESHIHRNINREVVTLFFH